MICAFKFQPLADGCRVDRCVCLCACTHSRAHKHAHTHARTRAHTCMHPCTQAHANTRTRARTCPLPALSPCSSVSFDLFSAAISRYDALPVAALVWCRRSILAGLRREDWIRRQRSAPMLSTCQVSASSVMIGSRAGPDSCQAEIRVETLDLRPFFRLGHRDFQLGPTPSRTEVLSSLSRTSLLLPTRTP